MSDAIAELVSAQAEEMASEYDVLMCYQILLGRDPENSFVIEEAKAQPVGNLIRGFLHSEEFATNVARPLGEGKRLPHDDRSRGPDDAQIAWLVARLGASSDRASMLKRSRSWRDFLSLIPSTGGQSFNAAAAVGRMEPEVAARVGDGTPPVPALAKRKRGTKKAHDTHEAIAVGGASSASDVIATTGAETAAHPPHATGTINDQHLDIEFYRGYYSDQQHLSSAAVAAHWVKQGRREHRYPNLQSFLQSFRELGVTLPAEFSPPLYRFLNPGAVSRTDADWKAIVHFIKHGHREGLPYRVDDLSPDQLKFISELYFSGRRPTSDALAALISDGSVTHYASMEDLLETNGIESDEFLKLFDAQEYLARNGNERLRNRAQCIRHFVEVGVQRLEPISLDCRFDPQYYWEVVPTAAELSPTGAYLHWINEGIASGESPNGSMMLASFGFADTSGFPEGFDPELYRIANPDLADVCKSKWTALKHAVEHGIPEGRKGCELSAETLDLYKAAADRLAKLNRLPAAKRVYEKLISYDSSSARAFQHYGDCLLRMEEYFAAAELYKERLALGKDDPWTFLNLAQSYLKLDNWAGAGAVLAELHRLRPGDQGVLRRYWEIARLGFDALSGHGSWLAANRFYDKARAQTAAAAALLGDAVAKELGTPRLARDEIRTVGIVAYLDLPQCTFYRVEQKKEQLAVAGIKVVVFDQATDLETFREALASLDAVIFYRVPAVPAVVGAIEAVRRAGLPSFYEVDDLLFEREHFPDSFASYGGQIPHEVYAGLVTGTELWAAAMSLCDYAIASTTPLLNAMQPRVVSRRGFVHRNALSAAHEPLLSASLAVRKEGPVRIFYGTGTKAHNEDFTDHAAPALARVLAKYGAKVHLVIVGYLTMPEFLEPYADQITLMDPIWDVGQYWEFLSRMDINLAVLKGGPVADCKSEIKWLEASAAGVPSIVSATQTYAEVIEDGVTGVLIASPEDWFPALDELISDPKRRRRIGRAARQAVRERYSLEAMARNLQAMFRDVTSAGRSNKRRLKVLIVNVFFPPQALGGATRIVADNVRDLRRLHGGDIDIEVFTSIEGGLTPYRLVTYDWEGVKVVGVTTPADPDIDHPANDPEMARLFAAHLDRCKPDLVHFHCIQRLTAAICGPARARGIPYLVTVHDGWWISKHQFLINALGEMEPYNFAEPLSELRAHGWDELKRMQELRTHLSGADKILAVSKDFAEVYRRCGFSNVIVMENGVTELPLLPRRPSADGKVRIGYFGGVSVHKGHYLIKTALTEAKFSNLSLTIIDDRVTGGMGSTHRWGSTIVHVRSKVPQTEMAPLYAEIDVLLAPSIWPESYGLVAREALQAGCWVVASDRGAVGADVTPDCGFVIDVGSAQGLLRVLDEIDRNPARYRGPTRGRVRLRRVEEQARELAKLYLTYAPRTDTVQAAAE